MRDVKIKEVIEKRGLDFLEVANQLFPGTKYPRLALNRVIAGNANLDSQQLSKFALMADLSISDLFDDSKWSIRIKSGVHIFTSEEFRAELDPATWITRIFHRNSMFHESIIHSGATPLTEYLQELNLITNKHLKK